MCVCVRVDDALGTGGFHSSDGHSSNGREEVDQPEKWRNGNDREKCPRSHEIEAAKVWTGRTASAE